MRGYPSRNSQPLSGKNNGTTVENKYFKNDKKVLHDLKINMILAVFSTILFIFFVIKKTGFLSLLSASSSHIISSSTLSSNIKCWSATRQRSPRIDLSNIKRYEREKGRNVFIVENCQKEKGLLVLLHGCSRLTASFFYSPEGILIVEKALKSGLSILAIAKNDERGCWDIENERLPLIELIHQLRIELNLQNYPLYGFGASSGGRMMTELTTSPLPFCAVNIQISPLENAISAPAVIYTFMKNDLTMLRFSKVMLPHVVAEKKIEIKILSIEKPMLDKKYFFNKINDIDESMSEKIFNTLKEKGILMEVSSSSKTTSPHQYFQLKDNPRVHKHLLSSYEPKNLNDVQYDELDYGNKNSIKSFYIDNNLFKILTRDEKLDALTIPLNEELNVLYNRHEIVATQFDKVLEFFNENNNNGSECLKANNDNLKLMEKKD